MTTFAHNVTIEHLASGKWRVVHSWLSQIAGEKTRSFARSDFATREEAVAWAFELEKAYVRRSA